MHLQKGCSMFSEQKLNGLVFYKNDKETSPSLGIWLAEEALISMKDNFLPSIHPSNVHQVLFLMCQDLCYVLDI